MNYECVPIPIDRLRCESFIFTFITISAVFLLITIIIFMQHSIQCDTFSYIRSLFCSVSNT